MSFKIIIKCDFMRKKLSLLIFLISGVAMGFAQTETPYNPFQGINLGI